ncbi:MAG: biliverdin-producing heme oxygenase [Planctomycetota bacterium]|jgi:heme oxygenase
MTTLAPQIDPQLTDTSLSLQLKRDTAELHTRAERSPRMSQLASGQMTRDEYGEHLAQLYLLHEGLERELEMFCEGEKRARGVVDQSQFQCGNALRDLSYLGVGSRTFRASAPVAMFLDELDEISSDRPWMLLGMHYVLEGSKNGGRYLARVVRQTYDLPEGSGDRYMDPYGDEQPERWAGFRASLDALELSTNERGDVLDGARMMFELFVDLGSV